MLSRRSKGGIASERAHEYDSFGRILGRLEAASTQWPASKIVNNLKGAHNEILQITQRESRLGSAELN